MRDAAPVPARGARLCRRLRFGIAALGQSGLRRPVRMGHILVVRINRPDHPGCVHPVDQLGGFAPVGSTLAARRAADPTRSMPAQVAAPKRPGVPGAVGQGSEPGADFLVSVRRRSLVRECRSVEPRTAARSYLQPCPGLGREPAMDNILFNYN